MDTLRISDADRATALDLLSEQYAIGRLDKEEFDERSDAVWSAKTQGDLAPSSPTCRSARPRCLLARPGETGSGGLGGGCAGGRDGPCHCCH
jgi:hypothetical protein